MKKKVLIYSDCNLFGGSEHVIYNIIRNPYLKEKFSFLIILPLHKLAN